MFENESLKLDTVVRTQLQGLQETFHASWRYWNLQRPLCTQCYVLIKPNVMVIRWIVYLISYLKVIQCWASPRNSFRSLKNRKWKNTGTNKTREQETNISSDSKERILAIKRIVNRIAWLFTELNSKHLTDLAFTMLIM